MSEEALYFMDIQRAIRNRSRNRSRNSTRSSSNSSSRSNRRSPTERNRFRNRRRGNITTSRRRNQQRMFNLLLEERANQEMIDAENRRLLSVQNRITRTNRERELHRRRTMPFTEPPPM
jgi:hypothetical protein